MEKLAEKISLASEKLEEYKKIKKEVWLFVQELLGKLLYIEPVGIVSVKGEGEKIRNALYHGQEFEIKEV